jgi:hypothetical protein
VLRSYRGQSGAHQFSAAVTKEFVMKHLETKKPKPKKRNPTQCKYPATAAAMLDYLPVLAGQFAMDNALKGAISANVVEWEENFDKLSISDAMKVIAHCV